MARVATAIAALTASALAQPPLGGYRFQQGNLGFRHCDYQAFATPMESDNDDFHFAAIPALNGNKSAVSFQSVNFPDQYISIIQGAEQGRLGIMANPDAYDASWVIVPGLANPAQASIVSLARSNFGGQYWTTLTGTLSGGCAGNYGSPSGDVVLTTGTNAAAATWTLDYVPPPAPPTLRLDWSAVTHTVSKRYLGCHSDPGYTAQPLGFRSNLIEGEAFEVPASWANRAGSGSAELDNANPFGAARLSSMRITATGSGYYSVSNRGRVNEGLFIEAGAGKGAYEGFVIVKSSTAQSLTVAIEDFTSNTVLATTTLAIAADGATWRQYNFTLTPSAGTTCTQIAPNSDPTITCGGMPNADHICVRCGGQFTIRVAAGNTVNVGYVEFQPGTWGRFAGLPVQQRAVDLLHTMGVSLIRSGGTVSQTFTWKDWRGPAPQRRSLGHKWGKSLVSGWGLFEVIDMCNAAGIEPVITLAYDTNSAQDWADLVDYCWGDATTTYGAMRSADGHPSPYRVSIFELGNEQDNPNFVAQVTAMEARRKAVKAPPFVYMYPNNPGMSAAQIQAWQDAGLPANASAPDIHVGGGGAVGAARDDWNRSPGFKQSAVNAETNAGTHNMARALSEGSDLNEFFNVAADEGTRLVFRTASFCMERSGGDYDAFDQGISFFLPHMVWIQPPGYVHAMIAQTWADQALDVAFPATWQSAVTVSAQKTAGNGNMTYVRMTNSQATASNVTITINNAPRLGVTATVWTLTASTPAASNSPSNPTAVSPTKASVAFTNGQTFSVPPYAYVIIGIPTA